MRAPNTVNGTAAGRAANRSACPGAMGLLSIVGEPGLKGKREARVEGRVEWIEVTPKCEAVRITARGFDVWS